MKELGLLEKLKGSKSRSLKLMRKSKESNKNRINSLKIFMNSFRLKISFKGRRQ